ncbi:hypothetical protein ACQPYK_25350 [Streptosporangium sp. CA-135522]|uniref:hypothetical protein n=1 Tax=Streptosporangium sp. CA-135522 TaxID=3240072 RepID=UPI003D93495E
MTDLELDLATVVARLEQVQAAGGWSAADPVVVERVLSCDLPRLRGHLSAEVLAFVDAEG